MTVYAVKSEIVDADTIVRIVVQHADLSDWQPEDGSTLLRRVGTVTVRPTEVLKGSLNDASDVGVPIDVVLRRPGGGRVSDFYALWAPDQVIPESDLVAFGVAGAARTLDRLLTPEHCFRLTWTRPLLDDLRLTSRLQSRHPMADQLLDAAAGARATAGPLFARYLWVLTREALRGNESRFDRLMQIAEDTNTRTDTRETYLVAAYEDITFTAAFPESARARLAVAMARTADNAEVGELQENLLGTYLPNLVRAPMPAPLDPHTVTGGIQALHDAATRSPALQQWLDDGPAGKGV